MEGVHQSQLLRNRETAINDMVEAHKGIRTGGDGMDEYSLRKKRKHVPFEPTKAAVKPLDRKRPLTNSVLKNVPCTNNINIEELVEQMAYLRSVEISKGRCRSNASDDELILLTGRQWRKERMAYEDEVKALKEENARLEDQLKIQSQVNREIKTLLVAAVGEDLETRVQHLTEDKLHLAHALLNSANNLTSHQEQIERLSGQCEVWRSKFLASSLMVEELGRWKTALNSRINDLQNTLRSLLEDTKKVRQNSIDTYSCLRNIVTDHLNNNSEELLQLNNADMVRLSNTNLKLSHHIALCLNCRDTDPSSFSENLEHHTKSEEDAVKLLLNPVTITNQQDAICNALVGVALSCTEQSRLYALNHATCCSHCKGEVQNI